MEETSYQGYEIAVRLHIFMDEQLAIFVMAALTAAMFRSKFLLLLKSPLQ
jgi:hypothetical protein